MDQKLIEKVAQSIWDAGEAPVKWNELFENEKEEWRVMAVAAIKTLNKSK